MKNNNFKWYVVIAVTGFVLFSTGIVLMILFSDSQGIMKTLPFILLGVGSGLLGGGVSSIITFRTKMKNPHLAKKVEIDAKDERNIAIANMAKAKVFDFVLVIFSLLIMFLALMDVGKLVIFVFLGAYFLIVISFIYLLSKYHKKM